MSVNVIPHGRDFDKGSPLDNIHRLYVRQDINPDDLTLLMKHDTEKIDPSGDENPITSEDITDESYSPSHSDYSSPISSNNRDGTHLSKKDPTKDSLIRNKDIDNDDEIISREIYPEVPSAVVDYYNETALKTKKRNELPDEAFGLPRLRMYPLTDKSHVQQAIRMFGHCKDPKDRETLAANIFKAMDKFKMTTKIGENNPLHEYAPKTLQESVELPKMTLAGFEVPMNKRTKEDIVKEHLNLNAPYYNNIFYGPDFVKASKVALGYTFLDHFYPDLKRMQFYVRLQCVCGGLASVGIMDRTYSNLNMRPPVCIDFNKPLGWCASKKEAEDDLNLVTSSYYTDTSNWFKVDLSNDLEHTFYCLRLYSVMGEILLDPNFDPKVSLDQNHYAVLLDWSQHVFYHYDLYKDAKDGSTEQVREMQYLWDLFWSPLDNPYDYNVVSVNMLSVLRNMAAVDNVGITMNEANIPGELVTKEECNGYLIHDLGLDDELYLLPATLEYPIIDKASVRLAMDNIWRIPEEGIKEYTTNLNRKYRELGCNFSISVDHPYARYADRAIVDNMAHILTEDSTVVDDQGTSSDRPPLAERPWYKRVDMVGSVDLNLADKKELGPNTKKQQNPDYTIHDSLL